jgi:hypothetical protein
MKSDTLFYTSPLEKYDPPIGLYSDDEVDQSMVRESLTIDVKRALNELKDRERDVLEEYYGFNGKPKTLGEIANKYGLSSVRIGQIHARAIRILRVKSTHVRSPIRHLQYYIAGSFKPLERSLNQPEGRLKPPERRLNLPKRSYKESWEKAIYQKQTPSPPLAPSLPPSIPKEDKEPIVRCLNCPNPRVSKDNLCGGCQGLKDRGFKLAYYERYLKRLGAYKEDGPEDGLFSQGFIDKLNEIL